MPEVIETYFDPGGYKGGRSGCWRARLRTNHGYHDAGTSEYEAVRSLLRTLMTFGKSGSPTEYTVERNKKAGEWAEAQDAANKLLGPLFWVRLRG
jgi:hypothetical protein